MDRLLTIMNQMTGKNIEELRKIVHDELDELEREVNAMKELLKVKPVVAVSSKAPVVKKGVKKTVVVANDDVIHTEVNPVVNTDNDVAKDTSDVLNATVVTALVKSKEEKKKPNSKTTGGRKKTAVASEASAVTVSEEQGQPHITDEDVKKNKEVVVEKEKKTKKTAAKKVSPNVSVTTTDTTSLKTNEVAIPIISVAPATEINTTESVDEKQTKETKKQQNKKEKNTSTEKPKSKRSKNKETVTESVVTSDQQQPSQQQPSQQQMSTSLLEIQTQSSLLGEQEQEQEQEEEVEVEEFVYDGVLYLKSLKGLVYDIETSEEIGIWNETTKSICVD